MFGDFRIDVDDIDERRLGGLVERLNVAGGHQVGVLAVGRVGLSKIGFIVLNVNMLTLAVARGMRLIVIEVSLC